MTHVFQAGAATEGRPYNYRFGLWEIFRTDRARCEEFPVGPSTNPA